jgi:hypothetical protein
VDDGGGLVVGLVSLTGNIESAGFAVPAHVLRDFSGKLPANPVGKSCGFRRRCVDFGSVRLGLPAADVCATSVASRNVWLGLRVRVAGVSPAVRVDDSVDARRSGTCVVIRNCLLALRPEHSVSRFAPHRRQLVLMRRLALNATIPKRQSADMDHRRRTERLRRLNSLMADRKPRMINCGAMSANWPERRASRNCRLTCWSDPHHEFFVLDRERGK